VQTSGQAAGAGDDLEAVARKTREILSGLEGVALPDHAEDQLAVLFTLAHAIDRKFVAAWRRWLWWDGIRWRVDETQHSFDLARDVCRAAARLLQKAKENEKEKLAASILSASTVAAVVKLASADRKHAAIAGQFDADPYLATSPGGTIDLRTGELQPHRRDDYITKCTAVTPDHGADCASFRKFLNDITCSDEDQQSYLARLFGLCLTGDTRDHILPFFLGTGANGKSTLLELMLYIFGDYARQVPSELLMEPRGERHPTETANLLGIRLAIASEVDEGGAWSESRIKTLTGDETMSGRFMRQDFFTFKRTHKLIVAGNHRPALRVVDDAIRRRIHLVPFNAHFVGAAVDLDMPAKLRREAPAILAWVVRGALDWQEGGLCPPAIVARATAEYLASQDTLGAWIDEDCLVDDPTAETPSSVLYGAFRMWKEKRGERALSQVRFSSQLEQRFTKDRRGGVVRFMGIQLRAPDLVAYAGGKHG
jgi:putative DNA primase/helicase